MACFLVPVAEAVVTTAATRALAARERAVAEACPAHVARPLEDAAQPAGAAPRIPLSRKLRWLDGMLWGGSALLALEHVWHGEIVPFFPFLSAASDPASLASMLGEMATVGVAMAVVVTAAWAVMCAVAERLARAEEPSRAAVVLGA